jgi:hypothetical protein
MVLEYIVTPDCALGTGDFFSVQLKVIKERLYCVLLLTGQWPEVSLMCEECAASAGV